MKDKEWLKLIGFIILAIGVLVIETLFKYEFWRSVLK